jgi:hypothetical protein
VKSKCVVKFMFTPRTPYIIRDSVLQIQKLGNYRESVSKIKRAHIPRTVAKVVPSCTNI